MCVVEWELNRLQQFCELYKTRCKGKLKNEFHRNICIITAVPMLLRGSEC